MHTGGSQRRRDNGLVAAEYASAGDVDPRVGEHLLDVLALDGIAAYLSPSTDLHPITRATSLPSRPTDSLFVDRAHVATARALLRGLTAEAEPSTTGASDIDQAWATIVVNFDADPSATSGGWPEAENLPRHGEARQDGSRLGESHQDGSRLGEVSHGGPTRPTAGGESGRAATEDHRDHHSDHPRGDPRLANAAQDGESILDGLDRFGANLPDDDSEAFTPPSPPPLPRPTAPTVLGIVGVLVGLLLVLRPGLLPIAEDTVLLLGVAALIAGFVTLVWRLRPGDGDEDDHDDDGARV